MDSLTRAGFNRNMFNIADLSRPTVSFPAPQQASNSGEALSAGEHDRLRLPVPAGISANPSSPGKMDSLTRAGINRHIFNIAHFPGPTTYTPAPRQASNSGEASTLGEHAQAHLPSDIDNPPSPPLAVLVRFRDINWNPAPREASHSGEAYSPREQVQSHLGSIPTSPDLTSCSCSLCTSRTPTPRQAPNSGEASTSSGHPQPHLPIPRGTLTRTNYKVEGLDIPAGFGFEDSDLIGVNMEGCTLIRCNVQSSEERVSKLVNCRLIDCDVESSHLQNCSIISFDPETSELTDCKIVSGRIWNAVSENCNFDGVRVEGLRSSVDSYFENCKIETCELEFGTAFGRGCEILNSYVKWRDEKGEVQNEWVVRRWTGD